MPHGLWGNYSYISKYVFLYSMATVRRSWRTGMSFALCVSVRVCIGSMVGYAPKCGIVAAQGVGSFRRGLGK